MGYDVLVNSVGILILILFFVLFGFILVVGFLGFWFGDGSCIACWFGCLVVLLLVGLVAYCCGVYICCFELVV